MPTPDQAQRDDAGALDPLDDRCTVVVVSYRHERFAEQCLESIHNQTIRCRVILFDNASPDNTVQVIERWNASHGSPVEVHAEAENLGICARLNQALAMITTPYFAYISTDDFWEPTHLEDSLRAIEEAGPDCVCVYGDAYQVDAAGAELPLCSETVPVPHHHDGDIFRELLTHNWIPTPSVVMRTAAVRRAGGYDERLRYEDHDMWLRLSRIGTFDRLAQPTSTARQVGSTSLTAELILSASLSFQRDKCLVLAKHVAPGAASNDTIAAMLLPKLGVLARSGEYSDDTTAILRRIRHIWPRAVLSLLAAGYVARTRRILRRAVGPRCLRGRA